MNMLTVVTFCICLARIVCGDQGGLKSCGGSAFTLNWSPAAISANEKYQISMSGTTATTFGEDGTANITVSLKGMSQPIFQNSQKASCSQVAPFAKGMFKCPITKGFKLPMTKFTQIAPKSVDEVPQGTYEIHVELKNEKGEMFMCAEGSITVKGSTGQNDIV